MTIKKIVGECLMRMGLDNFVNSESYTLDEQKLIDRLVFNANLVYREIVTSYLPLVDRAEIEIVDGEFAFASLVGVHILSPIRVEVGDESAKFKCYPTKIKCDYQGRATLVYSYLPSTDFALTDSIDDARVTLEAMVSGILAEYYFQNKVFDLAKNFDSEFREIMSTLKYKGRSMFLKERRW